MALQISPESEPKPARRVLVLVVDDEVSIVFALREVLIMHGWVVDCAAGPIDSQRLVSKTAYDVLITDLHLTPQREGEGMQLLRFVRSVSPRTRTIMLTAYANARIEAEAREHGVDRFFTKPIDLVRLTDEIESLLNAAS